MKQTVPLPTGFSAAGMHCGVKDDPSIFDLALFVSAEPCACAGVFTQNLVCGAPVKVSRQRVPADAARAVVINSGNANACTGERGIEDARWMTGETARQLGCAEESVLVCSTGVIGRFLPREPLSAGLAEITGRLGETPESLHDAVRGMMTTDTVPKMATSAQDIEGKTIRVSGVAKGAAMIGPNMATMLSVIMTDAALTAGDADSMLRDAVGRSFNCISVEGHTSTSDSVILLAGGAAGAVETDAGRASLQQMLDEVAIELAQAIIRDAEGADHFITIDVQGTRTREEATAIAKTIANDALVKTAITGADPNWGRIVSATGRAGVALEEKNISLEINGIPIYSQGRPLEFDETFLSGQMRSERDVHLRLTLDLGEAAVTCWTSDLTQEYVRLNSDYTT